MQLDIDFNPLQGNVGLDNAYRTFSPSSPLESWVQSFWQISVPHGAFAYHSVPDNSVDWIINTECFEDNFIVPPFEEPVAFELSGPVSYFGIRFRLLGYRGLIASPVGEWGEADTVNAESIISSSALHAVFESINKANGFHDRCQGLSATLLSKLKLTEIDARVASFVRYCYNNPISNLNLSNKQCLEFGVTARQLRRLTRLHLGHSPKEFSKVFRFQKVLKNLRLGHDKTAWVDHYYDQPHYIREFKRISGFTPSEFINLSVLYNHQ